MAAASAPAPVLLEDSWEADDVKEECARLGVPCQERTEDQLRGWDPADFVASTFMCSTEVCQQHLRTVLGAEAFARKVPGTYPEELRALLGRAVEQRELGSVVAAQLPLFVKPVSNDKQFDGRVLSREEDIARLLEEAERETGENPQSLPVWTAEVVHFLAEYRLFIGGGRLYGTGKIREDASALERLSAEEKERLGWRPSGSDGAGAIPQSFLDEVAAACGEDVFWAVDVGIMEKRERGAASEAPSFSWSVVEVNPALALDDHGLGIEPYFRFCADACAWLRS